MSAPRWALWDLQDNASFEFVAFMQAAFYWGANKVWLHVPNYWGECFGGEEEAKRRTRSIVCAACDLFRVEYVLEPFSGVKGDFFGALNSKHGSAWWTQKMLTTVKHATPMMPTETGLDKARELLKGRQIVVHMRRAIYWPVRNSSDVWRQWAADHDAYVLEDYMDFPLELDERVAISELARVNLGVMGGSMAPCIFSEHRPYAMITPLDGLTKMTRSEYWISKGMAPGFQFPWAKKNQQWIWTDRAPDYDAIEAAYKSVIAS